LVPNARVGIGHGQMDGKPRGTDVGFHERWIDVLVATTIIEMD
jgi:transcription-repair coupling factor (superfamily II helicase)